MLQIESEKTTYHDWSPQAAMTIDVINSALSIGTAVIGCAAIATGGGVFGMSAVAVASICIVSGVAQVALTEVTVSKDESGDADRDIAYWISQGIGLIGIPFGALGLFKILKPGVRILNISSETMQAIIDSAPDIFTANTRVISPLLNLKSVLVDYYNLPEEIFTDRLYIPDASPKYCYDATSNFNLTSQLAIKQGKPTELQVMTSPVGYKSMRNRGDTLAIDRTVVDISGVSNSDLDIQLYIEGLLAQEPEEFQTVSSELQVFIPEKGNGESFEETKNSGICKISLIANKNNYVKEKKQNLLGLTTIVGRLQQQDEKFTFQQTRFYENYDGKFRGLSKDLNLIATGMYSQSDKLMLQMSKSLMSGFSNQNQEDEQADNPIPTQTNKKMSNTNFAPQYHPNHHFNQSSLKNDVIARPATINIVNNLGVTLSAISNTKWNGRQQVINVELTEQ